ncbi:MAG: hypothetical protein IPK04_08255 [Bdellovibrionales bacterium]|nr:hypothetical protein [Bdellovibrionales bacterium]
MDSKASLTDFIAPNTFPEGVRDSFRESYSMLFVRLLNDSSGWSPEQSNDLFRLNLQALLNRNDFQALDLKDSQTHPLEKVAKILRDLKFWHERNNKKDAALDAELELLKIFHQRFTNGNDREAIQQKLVNLLAGPAEKTSWYSMGAATLAEFWMNDGSPGSPAKARTIAKKGEEAFPESLGAKYCRDLIKRIEAPHFELQAMSLDGPNRRSLGLDYKNISKIHFFGFKYDFKKFLEDNQDYSHYPGQRELRPALEIKADPPVDRRFAYNQRL